MRRAALLCCVSLAFLPMTVASVAGAASAPAPNNDPAQLTGWLTGLFHPGFYHRTLRGIRDARFDGAGEAVVRMDMTDDDQHKHDIWFYGVSRGPAGALVVRQYWMATADASPDSIAKPGLNALVHIPGCDLLMLPHAGAYMGKIDPKACKGEVEGRLFRVNRELMVDYGVVSPTVKPSAADKRKHPDDTGTEMYFRSEN